MFQLAVENLRGQKFTLTQQEHNYQILSIEGLNPPKARINSSAIAGMDGTRFASSKLEERNIVILIKINGDVETNRQYLYKYFRTKQYCKIFYKNQNRDIYAEGYVETIENSLFENDQTMQISIICQDPYLKAVDEIIIDISQTIAMFEFPFAFGDGVTSDDAIEFSRIEQDLYVNVINDGDDVSGVIIEITANGTVQNPIIYNVDTGQSIGINVSMTAGDVLTINTNTGQKSITLLHDGISTNYLKYLMRDHSNWLTLQIGDNQFTYLAASGTSLMQILFKNRLKYEGV